MLRWCIKSTSIMNYHSSNGICKDVLSDPFTCPVVRYCFATILLTLCILHVHLQNKLLGTISTRP
jgi:hypothetical protein